LNPIKVSDAYFPDFVRGFFDGDGTVYIYRVNNTPQIKTSFGNANLSFITDLNQRLAKELNTLPKRIHRIIPGKKRKKRIIRYEICFYIDDCKKLGKFMYQNNPSLYLPRKYKIFEKWKTIKRRKYIKQNYPSKIGWQLN
jgi:intein-encoded DNA endonuclease-like protein